MQNFPVMNATLRHRAWAMYKKQFGRIASVAAFAALLEMVVSLIAEAFVNQTVVYLILSLLSLGVTVLLSAGLYQMALHAWHEEEFDRLCLFRPFGRFGRLLGVTVLMNLPGILYALAAAVLVFTSYLMPSPDMALAVATVALLLIMPLSVVYIYFQYRLAPAYAAFVLYPEMRATECIRTSWRRSKGAVGRLFCNNIVLALPILAGTLLLSALFAGSPILLLCASAALSILYNGYFYLGTFALEEYLLTGETPCEAPQPVAASAPFGAPEAPTDQQAAIAALYPPETPAEEDDLPEKTETPDE